MTAAVDWEVDGTALPVWGEVRRVGARNREVAVALSKCVPRGELVALQPHGAADAADAEDDGREDSIGM